MSRTIKNYIIIIAILCAGVFIFFGIMLGRRAAPGNFNAGLNFYSEKKQEEEQNKEIIAPPPYRVATMSLSPDESQYAIGEIFIVDVLINTNKEPIDGVDIRYLVFDPEAVEIIDSEKNMPGTQIEAGALMPVTMANEVDQKGGKILFSQIVSGGERFQNNTNEVFARIHMKAIKSGPWNMSFDFTPNATNDANITSLGKDILFQAQGGSYEIYGK